MDSSPRYPESEAFKAFFPYLAPLFIPLPRRTAGFHHWNKSLFSEVPVKSLKYLKGLYLGANKCGRWCIPGLALISPNGSLTPPPPAGHGPCSQCQSWFRRWPRLEQWSGARGRGRAGFLGPDTLALGTRAPLAEPWKEGQGWWRVTVLSVVSSGRGGRW